MNTIRNLQIAVSVTLECKLILKKNSTAVSFYYWKTENPYTEKIQKNMQNYKIVDSECLYLHEMHFMCASDSTACRGCIKKPTYSEQQQTEKNIIRKTDKWTQYVDRDNTIIIDSVFTCFC